MSIDSIAHLLGQKLDKGKFNNRNSRVKLYKKIEIANIDLKIQIVFGEHFAFNRHFDLHI